MSRRLLSPLLALALLAAACSSEADGEPLASGSTDSQSNSSTGEDTPSVDDSPTTIDPSTPRVVVPVGEIRDFGEPPPVPTGDLSPEVTAALEVALGEGLGDGIFLREELDALLELGDSGDPRLAWLMADLLRIARDESLVGTLTRSSSALLGVEIDGFNPWGDVADYLIAWDVPAPPGYLTYKRDIYTLIVPEWGDLFVEGSVDWRLVSWGGVGIDDRPYDTTDDPCSCIPAADNPEVELGADSTWLDDDDVVFGVEIDGESRAYPRQIMEVREMVNDTLGGRDIAMPYCTLCGAAQVYLTDEVPDDVARPIMRTSGLLIRSNKVMYDVESGSVFDTFTGEARTGPLAEQGIILPQVGVVTSTWSDWLEEHPDTTVLVEELGFGRDPDFRNNRDANGPIFPIGDSDPRLAVQADVLGVITGSGTPVAFYVESAIDSLRRGEEVTFEDVSVVLEGSGIRAVGADGTDLGGHQAFWFAWSQFYPDTELWTAPS